MKIYKLDDVFNLNSDYCFLEGNCLEVLKTFPSNSINCVITSPPYWKLREYDTNDSHNESMVGDEKDFRDLFGQSGFSFMKSRENLIKEEIGIENYKIIEQIRKMNSQKGVQAMMPYEVTIK